MMGLAHFGGEPGNRLGGVVSTPYRPRKFRRLEKVGTVENQVGVGAYHSGCVASGGMDAAITFGFQLHSGFLRRLLDVFPVATDYPEWRGDGFHNRPVGQPGKFLPEQWRGAEADELDPEWQRLYLSVPAALGRILPRIPVAAYPLRLG